MMIFVGINRDVSQGSTIDNVADLIVGMTVGLTTVMTDKVGLGRQPRLRL